MNGLARKDFRYIYNNCDSLESRILRPRFLYKNIGDWKSQKKKKMERNIIRNNNLSFGLAFIAFYNSFYFSLKYLLSYRTELINIGGRPRCGGPVPLTEQYYGTRRVVGIKMHGVFIIIVVGFVVFVDVFVGFLFPFV